MIRVINIIVALYFSLNALDIKFNTDDLNDLYLTISSQKNINAVKLENRVPISNIDSSKSVMINSKDAKIDELQKDLKRLKIIESLIPKDTKQSELKIKLQNALFNLNSTKQQRFSFAYGIKYSNDQSFDSIYEKMQEKISLYIIQTYGISNVDYLEIMKNLKFDVEDIKSKTIGTVEIDQGNNLQNKFHYTNNETIKNGIISFIFYPFSILNRQDALNKNVDYSNNHKQNSHISFVDLHKEKNIAKIEQFLVDDDKNILNNYINNYYFSEQLDISNALSNISKKRLAYAKIANIIFAKYPQCENLSCIEKNMKSKLDKLVEFGGIRDYTYNYRLSSEVVFSDALDVAFKHLRRDLKHDTALNSIVDTETSSKNKYKRDTQESKITPVYKKITITPYIQNNQLGVQIKVKVSFESSAICSQYYLGKVRDNNLGITFIKLKNQNSDEIEVSNTEITNSQFNRIMGTKRDTECHKTKKMQEPANCISYEMLDKYLKKLNSYSSKYHYRFLSCQEWMFLATCGNKQKYCWGNSDNYKDFETIRKHKYGFELKKVALKKENSLHLFDFCGNAYEYCANKKGYYKTASSNRKTLLPTIGSRSWSDINSIRLVRERN